MRQVLLSSEGREMMAWLDEKHRFRVGDAVTLKNHREPKRLWTVLELYGTRSLNQINRSWRVGGLS